MSNEPVATVERRKGTGWNVAKTVESAFGEFKTNLEITNRQEGLVSTRRTGVVDALAKSLTLHPERSKLIGSYDRHTLTKYLSEGDVDVMVVLHYGENKGYDSADGTAKVLDRFKAILDPAYPSTTIRRDRNCVTMAFSDFRLDVVPAFKNDGGYYRIPDSVRRNWLQTDPFTFAGLITKVNKQMDGDFIPLVKMIKAWNRQHDWPIRSFHLECLMYNRYKGYTKGYTYSSMVKTFFEALPALLQTAVYDPVRGDRVDGYMDLGTPTRRSKAVAKARSAATQSAAAYADQDNYPITSIGQWKALMGDFFPSYG